MSSHFFTSESVCAGHPDKIADQISDAILDAALEQDPLSRVAVETLVTTNRIVLAGEVTTGAKIAYKKIVQEQLRRLGYTEPLFQFGDYSPISVLVHQQSAEIAAGVDLEGAGDQGMMFGYACTETPQLMPAPIMISHALAKEIDHARESKLLPYLRPDGKTQVTLKYEHGKPIAIETIVIAVPHQENITLHQVKKDILQYIIAPVVERFSFSVNAAQVIVNGTGVWHVGGPTADTGLTGRKIIVDGYGGYARVGGGCFSGKDPTKVDRSGAYAARYLAKKIVHEGLAERAEVGLAYCIGQAQPVMKSIESFGTANVSEKVLRDFVDESLDTSVRGIIEALDLRKPIYLRTASYGHFGKEEFPWEILT